MNREQLKIRLTELKITPSAYSLSGGLPNECYVLGQQPNGLWEVYYSERGQKNDLHIFDSEASASQFLLEHIVQDTTVKRGE
jgi:hypothetical protein